MANLPQNGTSTALAETDERFMDAIVEQLAAGRKPRAIATSVWPRDKFKRRKLEHKIWKLATYDSDFQKKILLRAKAEMMVALGATSEAVGQRAGRGRVDAARLVFETTGFHNSKVKHEHSGDISLTLNVPRPSFDGSSTQLDDPEITDAEVVEDEKR